MTELARLDDAELLYQLDTCIGYQSEDTALIRVAAKRLRELAAEREQYRIGMANWKATAEAKDAGHAILRDKLAAAESRLAELEGMREALVDGFDVLLAASLRLGFFGVDGEDREKVLTYLGDCPPREGITVGSAIDAAYVAARAAREQGNG